MIGIVEIFLFILILNASEVGYLVTIILGLMPGLITVLSADSTLKKNKRRRVYFGAIWNILKYNPFTYSMLLFILGDFLSSNIPVASRIGVFMAILGIISVFGRNGVLNNILGPLGFNTLTIYGLHGIILANVFFNIPLVSRLLLQGWKTIPAEQFRLAESLCFNQKNIFFIV